MPAFRIPKRLTAGAAALAALTLGVGAPAHADATNSRTKPVSPSAAVGASSHLAQAQASTLARRTGKAVPVTALETAKSTVTANPDGSFTLDEHPAPVRKIVNGVWKPLDATLVRRADGTIAPAVTTQPLVLSGGGNAPLAQMRAGADALTLRIARSLPVPKLSGATATYSNVIRGVDLQLTANTQGGFSELLIVHSAAAAADPGLSDLFDVSAYGPGLKLSTDKDGNLTAVDSHGKTAFSAPAPEMWDSSASAGPSAATATGSRFPTSTAAQPGSSAHVGRLATRVAPEHLLLSPDVAVLRGTNTVYPVYVHPGYGPDPDASGWSTPSSSFPNDIHWDNSAESHGLMQTGKADGFQADTLMDFDIPLGSLSYNGVPADLTGVHFYITPITGYSCSGSTANLYAPDPKTKTLNKSNATWNNWFTDSQRSSVLGSSVASASFNNGYSSGCAASSVGFSSGALTSAIARDVGEGKGTQTLALAGPSNSAEASSTNYYTVFDPATPDLQINWDNAPTTPTALATSPESDCSGGSVVGDGDVTLYAHVFDPDGDTLGVSYNAYVTGNPSEVIASSTPSSLSETSGNTAGLLISEATLRADASKWGTNGGTNLPITWSVGTSDGTLPSPSPNPSCSFTFNDAYAGSPIVTEHLTGTKCNDTSYNSSASGHLIGQSYRFDVAPAANNNAIITGYRFQINGTSPTVVTVNSAYDGSYYVKLTRVTNVLDVIAITAGGNVGYTTACVINATMPSGTTEQPGDLTGDGRPDLLAPGNVTDGLPGGLWLSQGDGADQLNSNPINIGVNGNGTTVNGGGTQVGAGPNSFSFTQPLTGLFSGTGVNDVLDYNPYTGTAQILSGSGSAAPLNPNVGEVTVAQNTFTDNSGHNASSVANGGTLYQTASGSTITGGAEPDLLQIIGGVLYDNPGAGNLGGWSGGVDLLGANTTAGNAISGINPYCQIAADNCATDWTGWTITSALINGLPALFARDTSTSSSDPAHGQLWYFSASQMLALAKAAVLGGQSPAPTELAASGFDYSTVPYLQAVPVFGGNEICLWTLSAGRTMTPYLLAVATGSFAGFTADSLDTPTHYWAMNSSTLNASGNVEAIDTADTSVTPALYADGANATGTTWTTDYIDSFAPNVNFSTPQSGYLATSGQVIATNQDFTVSVWVRPTALQSQAIVSQDGNIGSGFIVYDNNSTVHFALANSDASGWNYTDIFGGSDPVGAWTQITATYSASSSAMTLYVNGVRVASASHAPVAIGSSASPLIIGADKYNGSHNAYLDGKVGAVQTWNSVVPPQPAPDHQWTLADKTSGTVATAADTGASNTPLTLTGYNQASWHANDLFNPDVVLSASTNDYLGTAAPAINTAADFTVSAWVYPSAAATQVIASQDGSPGASSGFILYLNTSGKAIFALATQDASGWNYDSVSGGAVPVGSWHHLVATFSSGSKTMSLYVDNAAVASGVHTPVSTGTSTSFFVLGADELSGARNAYFSGTLADVHTYNAVLTTAQVGDIN